MLTAGTIAPDFTLPDKDGTPVSLSDFRGRTVVLYFYPRDGSPGCTRQAQAFRDAYNNFQAGNIAVIGISRDSVKSHANFVAKHNLPFVLLSDPDRKAIEAFGVWQEKKLYGKVSMGVVRATFLINAEGVIEKVFEKAKPDSNASEILAYLNHDR